MTDRTSSTSPKNTPHIYVLPLLLLIFLDRGQCTEEYRLDPKSSKSFTDDAGVDPGRDLSLGHGVFGWSVRLQVGRGPVRPLTLRPEV